MKTVLLSENLIAEYNARVAGELEAESMYRQMANICQNMGLFGSQKYFLAQAVEEGGHYQKLVDILNDYGVVPAYAFEIPSVKCTNISECLNQALEAERKLYVAYSNLAKNFEDVGTHETALEFVKIQRMAVGEVSDIIAKLDLSGDIYAFDEYLGGLA